MENQKSRENLPENGKQNAANGGGAPLGFDGMNFEEQRGSYKNSDGQGASYDREESMKQRNGQSAPNQ